MNFSLLHPFCFSFPVVVTLLSFTLVSSSWCLQHQQLLQCKHTTGYGCLASSNWSSVISDWLLKGWARLAPSPFLPLVCLPMRSFAFVITTSSADGEEISPSSLWAASWCTPVCRLLRRSWPSGLHRDGAYPSSAGLMISWTCTVDLELCAKLGHTSSLAERLLTGPVLQLPWSLLLPLVSIAGISALLLLSLCLLFWEGLDTVRWDTDFYSCLLSIFIVSLFLYR